MLKRKTLAPLGATATLIVMAQFGAGCGSEITVWNDGGGGSQSTSSTGNQSTGNQSTGTSSSTSGGPTDLSACDGVGQCELVPASCCGFCGQPATDDMTGIHKDQLDAHRNEVCGDDAACPACYAEPDPNLFAYCDQPASGNGSCVAADVRTHDLSVCEKDSDCRLRMGLDCCEGCFGGVDGVVAISTKKNDELSALACGPELMGCPECAPDYPDDAIAVCTSGHCEVAFKPAPPPGG